MNSGKLNRRVTVQSPAGSRDAYGERTTTWSTLVTDWAAIEPLSVREQFTAAQQHGSATHRVTMRYGATISAVTAGHRILFGSRVFVLTGPARNPDERNQWLEFICQEGERTE